MSEGPGFLEFFILEASDYVEQLDGLLLGGSPTGPDADALQRVARALRGTATMAKLPSFAEVAAAVERVGRAMQEGSLRWDATLGGAMVATIDDLKALLHSARTWSAAEDQRASSRTAELARFAPARPFAPTRDAGAPRSAIAGSAFLATESSNIAAGLELLSTRAGAADTAANLLRRIRALRGVAGVKSVAPLADVLEATEDLARGLEFGEKTMNGDARQLLETSAEYLRVISSALRFDGDFNAPSAARDAFLAAQSKWMNQDSEQERVVPISTLFYSDGGPDVIEASPNPPTSTVDRFRLELVSHGEHLRQVVDTVRQGDASARSRRDLSRALSDLQAAAESFGERDLAEFVRAHSTAADRLDPPALGALDDLAAILSAPGAHGERLTARLRELHRATEAPVADHSAFTEALGEPTLPSVPEVTPQLDSRPEKVVESEPSAIAEPVAVHEPEPVAVHEPEPVAVHEPEPVAAFASVPPPQTPPEPPRAKTPAQAILSAASSLIDMSLAALDSLTATPWLEPEQIAEDTIVPIESLLYRGSAALERAIEIRDELRQSETPADADALDELFDLLELARPE